MGKGFENYMSKKWFHPTNVENQKRKFLAEQKNTAEKKRQQELRDQYEREQEIFSNKQLMGDEKARLGLSFMYNAPGSLKDQEKKNDEKIENNEKLDWQISTSREQPTRNHELTNVRCLKCKRLGHVNTSKLCPLYGKSRLDVESNSLTLLETEFSVENIESERLELKHHLVLSNNKNSLTENLEEKDENDEITLDMLKALPKIEKKVLLKRLMRLDKKIRKQAKI